MKCLRCGHCCTTTLVTIVVDPDIGPADGNLRSISGYEERCPHLFGDEVGKYSCAVHDRPWYHETPCFSHGQVESSKDEACRMGAYQMKLKREACHEK